MVATLCILPLVVAAHVVRVVVVVIALIFGSFRGPSICYLSSRSCLACPYSLPFGLPGAVLWDSRRSFWHPLWQPLWTLLQVSIGCLSGSCPGAPGQALLAHLLCHWVTHRVFLGFLFGILFGSLYVHFYKCPLRLPDWVPTWRLWMPLGASGRRICWRVRHKFTKRTAPHSNGHITPVMIINKATHSNSHTSLAITATNQQQVPPPHQTDTSHQPSPQQIRNATHHTTQTATSHQAPPQQTSDNKFHPTQTATHHLPSPQHISNTSTTPLTYSHISPTTQQQTTNTKNTTPHHFSPTITVTKQQENQHPTQTAAGHQPPPQQSSNRNRRPTQTATSHKTNQQHNPFSTATICNDPTNLFTHLHRHNSPPHFRSSFLPFFPCLLSLPSPLVANSLCVPSSHAWVCTRGPRSRTRRIRLVSHGFLFKGACSGHP